MYGSNVESVVGVFVVNFDAVEKLYIVDLSDFENENNKAVATIGCC